MQGGGNQNSECNDFHNYIPDSHTPMKYVQVNFHFMQMDDIDNPLNFAEDWDGVNTANPMTGDIAANQIVDAANGRLSSNGAQTMPPGNSTPTLDRKFRLVLKGVYYHADSDYWDQQNLSILSSTFGINIAEEINVFMVGSNELATGQNSAILGGSVCQLEGVWNHYHLNLGTSDPNNWLWINAFSLLHEIGHCLTLSHTERYNSGPCCDTCDDSCSDTPTRGEIIANFGFDPCCDTGNSGQFCDNNLLGYSQSGDGLTPQQLGRVHYDLTHGHIEHLDKSTYCMRDETQTETILSGEILEWHNVRIMRGDLVLEPNSKLSIYCTVYMPEDAKIIVKPGAKLYVIGGTITNRCSGLWAGIEVWGASSQWQIVANQGLVHCSNNSTLENARCAIRTIKNTGTGFYDNLDWSTTGGIIRCTSTEFKNNLKGVEFMWYQNIHYNQQNNNVSYFRNCTFITEDVSHMSGATATDAITMWGVVGVRIEGCTFDYTVPVSEADQRGNGIRAALSTFKVRDFGSDRNLFQHLNRAIDATGPLKYFYPYVDHAQFFDNRGGVLLVNYGRSVITRNDFNWHEITTPDDVNTYGVYLHTCSGYKVEENHFNGNDGVKTFGVAVNSSGENITQIYKNYFTNLHAASQVYGDNRKEEDDNTGLQWLCNEYGVSAQNPQSNTYHQNLWGATFDPVLPIASQAYFQGTNPSISAGNNFYPECAEGSDEHELKLLEEDALSYFNYVHDAPAANTPECRTQGIGLTFTGSITPSTSCNSQLTGHTPSGAIAHINQNNLLHQQIRSTYDEYANNGNGPYLVQLINNPNVSSMELRNALMDAAPTVTDAMLVNVLQRNPPLDGWHMAQALIANSPLKEYVMIELAKTDYMPFYQALVEIGKIPGISTRTFMEMDLAHTITEQYQSFDELMRLRMDVEEDESHWSEIYADLISLGHIADDLDRIFYFFEKGDLALANTELGKSLELETEEEEIVEALLGIAADGKWANGEERLFQDISDNATHIGKSLADQYLKFWGSGSYEEFLRVPNEGLRSMKHERYSMPEIKTLAVYPNPANDHCYISYIIPSGWEMCLINVYDAQGVRVESFNGKQFNGIIELTSDRLSAGIYTIELVVDDLKIANTKLEIVR